MASFNSPASEVSIDADLVKQLLSDQHPDLADLPVQFASEGWDNAQFLLGKDLVVRLPLRLASANLILHEQRWLGQLAPRLPLPIPVPVRHGRPSDAFGWPWSICPWVEGQDALHAPIESSTTAALQMAVFLRALHTAAPLDAPANPFRGVPLAKRNDLTLSAIVSAEEAGYLTPRQASQVRKLWADAVGAPIHTGQPVWLHGDLHPGNVIVADDRIVSIVDWGDITSGDPACDLAILWRMFDAPARAQALDALKLDETCLLRTRGWTIAIAMMFLTNSADRPLYLSIGHRSLNAALEQ
ncbi:MAG: aminoglycoside phosphotransferase family protein [Acidimicrobiales bacterium]|nr:aminoglycoside phosphotransferase family protein [Acidimicrobiales bacterium]